MAIAGTIRDEFFRSGPNRPLQPGGSILPPMPWQNYSKMTDDDLKALWACLQSIKPVKNKVREPVRAAGAKSRIKSGSLPR